MYIQATFKGVPGDTVHCFEVGRNYTIWVLMLNFVTLSPVEGMTHSTGARITEIRSYITLKEFLTEWDLD